ncbi:MAG: hypothetical protein Q6373_015430 [Candidatus Sigynarchaeota archaeon]
MALTQEQIKMIVDVIIMIVVLLIIAAILNAMSKGIIRNRHAGSFGRAFFVVLIGVGIWYVILKYMVPYLTIALSEPFAYFIGLVTIWLAYAGLIYIANQT